MLKHISIIFTFLLLLLTGCRSDDLNWGGQINTEEEIAIAFQTKDMRQVSTGTRAFPTVKDKIGDITEVYLLVFNSAGKLHYDCSYPKSKWLDGGVDAVKVKRSLVVPGNWYLVANDKGIVKSFIDSYGTAEIPESEFRQKLLTEDEVIGTSNSNKALMVAKKEVSALPTPNSPVMEAFTLRRRFAQVTFKVNPGIDFLVTGVALYRQPKNVQMDSVTSVKGMRKLSASDWIADALTGNGAQGTTGNYMLPSDELTFLTLPVSNKMPAVAEGEAETDAKTAFPEARLVIRGYMPETYEKDADDNDIPVYGTTPTYFAYKFSNAILTDHHYKLTLKEVVGQGESTFEAAAKNPVGAVVLYEDDYNTINNMVTDGEHVIALPDSITAESNGFIINETASLTRTFDVYWRDKDNTQLLSSLDQDIKDEFGSLPSWIKLERGATSEEPDANADGSDIKRFKTTFTLKVDENNGSEREAELYFALKSTKIDALNARMVIVQKAPAAIDLSEMGTLTLAISGDITLSETNYLVYVGNTEGTGAKAVGVEPAANGGRVRNVGLHIPMPCGETTYKYTLTLNNGWSLSYRDGYPAAYKATKDGNTYTFTFAAEDATDTYEIWDDAISITNGVKTFTLDLYRTGFFHKLKYNGTEKWLYYEVFKAGTQRWLDRNIGATSAGMAQYNTTLLSANEWPMAEGAVGEYYNYADASKDPGDIIPPGWRLPSQGDFEILKSQANFVSSRFTAEGATFFLPSYAFKTVTNRKNGTTDDSRRLEAYFPHSRYKDGDNIAGTSGVGYYWTSTGTDNANFSRCMIFMGQDVSVITKENKYRLSLRCVGGPEGNQSETVYKCYVKGFTHVFLYAQKGDEKVYLTTWPGTQVAVSGMTSGENTYTKTFEYTSFVDYEATGYDIMVIFNNVSNGNVVSNESNVEDFAVRARNGIPFRNGKIYDYNSEPKLTYPEGSNYVRHGNWKDAPAEPPLKPWTIAFIWKSNYDGSSDWAHLAYNNNFFTEWQTKGKHIGDDYYYLTRTVEIPETYTSIGSAEEAKYMHMLNGGDENKRYWSNGYHKRLTQVPTGVDADEAFLIWHYNQPADPAGSVGPTTYSYYLVGANINGGAESWTSGPEMTETNGKFKISDVKINGKFKVLRTESTSSNTTLYGSSDSDDSTNINPGDTKNTRTGNVSAFNIASGTYTVTFDPSNETISVTGTADPTPTDNVSYRVMGLGDWDNGKPMTESNGIWSADLNNVSGEFKIRRIVNDTPTNDDKWYGKNELTTSGPVSGKEKEDKYNLELKSSGNFIFTFDPNDMTLKVTRTSNVKYYLRGDSNGWDASSDPMTLENGKWVITKSISGSFKLYESTDDIWFGPSNSDDKEFGNGGTKSCTTNDNGNFNINNGTYTFSFDPVSQQLTVTSSNSAVLIAWPEYSDKQHYPYQNLNYFYNETTAQYITASSFDYNWEGHNYVLLNGKNESLEFSLRSGTGTGVHQTQKLDFTKIGNPATDSYMLNDNLPETMIGTYPYNFWQGCKVTTAVQNATAGKSVKVYYFHGNPIKCTLS